MRMLKYKLHEGMNAIKCDTNKVLMLRYLNDQCGKIMGWFENAETEGRMVVMDMTFDQIEVSWRACPKSSQ